MIDLESRNRVHEPDDGDNGRPTGARVDRASFGSVYLTPFTPEAPLRRLNWLVRSLGLEHYSPKLLTEKVRIELTVLAFVLLATFLFELIAWFFLFNGLLVGYVTRFHWGLSSAALVLALLFSGAILFFERQVIVTDPGRLKRWEKLTAMGIRAIAILFASFIVAHVIDLVAFRVPLEKRLHAETVHEYALARAEDIRGMSESEASNERKELERQLEEIGEALEQARQAQNNALGDQGRSRAEVAQLEQSVRRLSNSVSQAERRLVGLDPEGDDASLREAQADLAEARRQYETELSMLRSVRGDLGASEAIAAETTEFVGDLTARATEINLRLEKLGSRSDLIASTSAQLESRLLLFIGELANSDFLDLKEEWAPLEQVSEAEKELWPDHWREQLTFKEADGHLFERLHALYSVVLWWSDDPSDWKLPEYLDSIELYEEPSKLYLLSFIMIHLAAMLIPLLVFTVKWFLMPKEVNAYYSAWHQAFAGDAEARLMLNVEEKVMSSSRKETLGRQRTPQHSGE